MKGYIQVSINGKTIGLKFSMYAGENLSSVKGNPTSSANIVRIIWVGVLGNAYTKQIEPEITFEEVVDWVEDKILNGDEEGIIQKISDTFLSAEPIKKLIERSQELEEEAKKKK